MAVNTETLAKHYNLLTARERLTLIEAALNRDDESESNRLIYSAPKVSLHVPNYLGFTEAIESACFLYMLDQLNLATCYRQAEGLHETVAERNFHERTLRQKKDAAARQAREDRLCDLVRFLGYRIVTNAEAWQRLCAKLNLEPNGLLRHLPGYDMFQEARRSAEMMAFNTDEARQYLRRSSDKDCEPITAETLFAEWCGFIDHRTKWWGTE